MAKKQEQEFVRFVMELMQPLTSVTAKRMFGGTGIFYHGLMFALIANDTLYFKVDEALKAECIDRGMAPFTYIRQGKELQLGYYQAPEEVFEDSDEMVSWSRKAIDVALKANTQKRSG